MCSVSFSVLYVVCSLSVLIFHLFELVAPAVVVVVVVDFPVESDSYFDFIFLFVSVCFASFYLLLFVFLGCLISSLALAHVFVHQC